MRSVQIFLNVLVIVFLPTDRPSIVFGQDSAREPKAIEDDGDRKSHKQIRSTHESADKNPLCDAVNGGDIQTIRRLLLLGAPPNAVDKLGRSALFLAADRQDPEAVKALLGAGADPNRGVISPLMLASSYGSKPVVKLLIEYGANVNALSKDGETAIMFAVCNGHLDTVRTLLAAGASTASKDNGERNLIDYTRDDEIELQEVVRSGKPYATKQPLSPTEDALCRKIEAGDYNGVSQLLSLNPRARPPCARALIAAVNADEDAIVRLLLEKGGGANVADEYRRSVLYLATGRNNLKIVDDLLAKGADANADTNMKPLMLAADRGLLAVAEALIKGGARLNSQTRKSGSTALHFAVDNNHIGVVNLLIGAGADIGINDKEGRTAVDYADDNRIEIRHALEAAAKGRGGIHPTTTF